MPASVLLIPRVALFFAQPIHFDPGKSLNRLLELIELPLDLVGSKECACEENEVQEASNAEANDGVSQIAVDELPEKCLRQYQPPRTPFFIPKRLPRFPRGGARRSLASPP
jgi:hypothetical protein